MKATITLLILFFLFKTVQSQTFFAGATDTSGDKTQPLSPDAKAIFHAIDITADSLWFKIEFYKRTDNISWNIKIGLDTNNNINDGGTWTGSNQTMKYDLLADIYNNPGFPPPLCNLLSGNGTYIHSNIGLSFPDTNIVVIGMRLSDIKQTGKPLHYIAGTGIVAGLVNDDIPDANYITISGATGVENMEAPFEIISYPNPVQSTLHISAGEKIIYTQAKYEIRDENGKVLISGSLCKPEVTVNIESLFPGIYFLTINSNEYNLLKKLIKQ